MREGLLKPGVVQALEFRVPREKTVPFLYPEFRALPEVFATGFMIGLGSVEVQSLERGLSANRSV